MSVRWTVRIDGVRPHKLARAFLKLGSDSKITIKRAAYEVARAAEREVRQLYYSYARGQKPGDLQTSLARAGKEQGADAPAKPPSETHSTMLQIGRNIVTKPIANEANRYTVMVNPEALSAESRSGHPFGISLASLAHFIENRIATTWPMTLRMMGYLMTTRRGKGGFGTRKRNFHMPNRQVRLPAIVVTPPDMPVWRVVATRIHQLAPLLTGELQKIVLRAIEEAL